MITRPQRDRTGALREMDMDDPEIVRKRRTSATGCSIRCGQHSISLTSTARCRPIMLGAGSRQPGRRLRPRAISHRCASAASHQRLRRELSRPSSSRAANRLPNEELTRLKVEDFNPDSSTLQIRMSKSGKSRHVVLTEEGETFFAGLCAGRKGSEPMIGGNWLRNGRLAA